MLHLWIFLSIWCNFIIFFNLKSCFLFRGISSFPLWDVILDSVPLNEGLTAVMKWHQLLQYLYAQIYQAHTFVTLQHSQKPVSGLRQFRLRHQNRNPRHWFMLIRPSGSSHFKNLGKNQRERDSCSVAHVAKKNKCDFPRQKCCLNAF